MTVSENNPDPEARPAEEDFPDFTRDDTPAAQSLPRERVPLPELRRSVWVYGLTAGEWDKYEESLIDRSGKRPVISSRDASAKLALLAVRDAEGKRIWFDADLSSVSRMSARILDRICRVAQRLSQIGAAAREDLEKNSEQAQAGASN